MRGPVWLVNETGTTKGKVDDVMPHSSCCPVISFDKIWVMAGRFGVTLRTQALICHPKQEQTLEDLFAFDPMED